MKRQYSKPMLSVEHYSLTQAVAACYIKIFVDNSKTVQQRIMEDPDSTIEMKNVVRHGGFTPDCNFSVQFLPTPDGTCYHTNSNGAFSS